MERVVDGVRYRIQSEPFNMMDYEAIERHLEEMAAEGWIFKALSLPAGNTTSQSHRNSDTQWHIFLIPKITACSMKNSRSLMIIVPRQAGNGLRRPVLHRYIAVNWKILYQLKRIHAPERKVS